MPIVTKKLPVSLLARCAGLLFFLASLTGLGNVKLPMLISDHMVLQAGEPVPVWGWANPDERIEVTIGGQTLVTNADTDGNWSVTLSPLKSGGHLTLMVQGENEIVVNDVLAGEVWLGSGQSNMGFPVKMANAFAQEQAVADHPEIRMFTLANNTSPVPLADCQGRWEICNAATVGNFSAVLYFFGRDLHESLKDPVGLIHSSWGGTPIQPWISVEALKEYPGYATLMESKNKEIVAWPAREKKILADIKAWEQADVAAKAAHQPEPVKPWNPGPPDAGQYMPGRIYNAMIHPLIHYRIRGSIWYQGESNADGGAPGAKDYTDLQTRLVTSWRADWNIGDFPFYYVQLPNYNNDSWAFFREGQAKVLKVPNTGMAVTIDLGEANNIHPTNKQEAGHRLALIALANVYGNQIVFLGPQFAKCETNGAKIIIKFLNTNGGLVARDGALRGFVIAGADKQWHSADAKIEKGGVIVSSPNVPEPLAVRYDWAGNPDGNLYNDAGLPAMPFRTDQW
jgi:sialate O-acetylesterase